MFSEMWTEWTVASPEYAELHPPDALRELLLHQVLMQRVLMVAGRSSALTGNLARKYHSIWSQHQRMREKLGATRRQRLYVAMADGF
jgi:hypothetical protein